MKYIINIFYCLMVLSFALSAIVLILFVFSFLVGSRFWSDFLIKMLICFGSGLGSFLCYSVTKACWIYIENNKK